MANYVLVHGAWGGGQAYQRLAAELKQAGHEVLVAALTGLGVRSDELHAGITLTDHVNDVCDQIDQAGFDRFILAGHSYGGMVITGAADALRDRVRHLVYLDAAAPADGQTLASFVPGATADEVRRREAAYRSMAPDGTWLAPVPPAMVGVTEPDDVQWLQRRLRPHPLRTWLDPIALPHGGHAGIRKTYVMAANPPTTAMGYPRMAEAARAGGEWICHEIDCGHDMMVVDPVRTAAFIAEAAA